jgi:hypothetical protein
MTRRVSGILGMALVLHGSLTALSAKPQDAHWCRVINQATIALTVYITPVEHTRWQQPVWQELTIPAQGGSVDITSPVILKVSTNRGQDDLTRLEPGGRYAVVWSEWDRQYRTVEPTPR